LERSKVTNFTSFDGRASGRKAANNGKCADFNIKGNTHHHNKQ